MKKTFPSFLFITLACFLFSSHLAFAARGSSNGFNAFYAAGPNFITPYSVRLGWGDWEGLLINGSSLGASKRFKAGPSTYSSFGFAMNTDNGNSSLGAQIAAGFNYGSLAGFSFRGELLAIGFLSGSTNCNGLFGVAYGF